MKPTLPQMICFSLYCATHAMQRVYAPLLAPLGLTYPQYLVLMSLWHDDGQTVGELGRALQLESNTLTPLLKRLENQGLVQRLRDENDERQVRIRLTSDGRDMQGKSAHISACIFDRCGMEMADLAALQQAVMALRDRLLQDGQAPT